MPAKVSCSTTPCMLARGRPKRRCEISQLQPLSCELGYGHEFGGVGVVRCHVARRLDGYGCRWMVVRADFTDAKMVILEDLGAAAGLGVMMSGKGAPADHRLLITPNRQRQYADPPVGGCGTAQFSIKPSICFNSGRKDPASARYSSQRSGLGCTSKITANISASLAKRILDMTAAGDQVERLRFVRERTDRSGLGTALRRPCFGRQKQPNGGLRMDTVERTDANLRETARLIASDKVESTSDARRAATATRIGTIERVMIDKRSGNVGLRGDELWRVPRHGRRLRLVAVACPALQREPRRL